MQPPPWPTKPAPTRSKRLGTLSTVAFVLVGAEFLSLANKVLSPLLGKSILLFERSLLGSLVPPGTPNPLSAITSAAEELAAKLALWELVRAVPFLAMNGLMLWIALRLRKGERRALLHARQWIYGAMAAIVISVVLQITVIIPATLDYARKMTAMLPTPPAKGGAPPFDVGAFTSSITLFSSIFSAALSTLMLAVWPVVLYLWSARLEKELSRDGFWSTPPPVWPGSRRS